MSRFTEEKLGFIDTVVYVAMVIFVMKYLYLYKDVTDGEVIKLGKEYMCAPVNK